MTGVDGIDVGNVSVIAEIGGQPWIGGKLGIEYLRNDRLWDLKMADDDSLPGVSGLVQGKDGDLWMNTISGVYRLAHADIALALSNSEHRVQSDNFGYLDGIVGTPEEVRPLPTAIRAPVAESVGYTLQTYT